MKQQLARLFLVPALLLAWVPVFAHHSFSAEFDINQPVTLRGVLSKFEWVNPHGWIYIDVKDAEGKVVTWAIETGGPNALLRRGIRRTDFPLGTELVIKGFRAKNGTPTANANTIALPDGRRLFAGSSGNGAPEGEQ
jgi:hypothetical protein